jgi:YcaO-like protein with predicted kinase domain
MLAFGGQTPGVKTYRSGTHRTVTPEETIARLQPLMHEFGITRVANLTGLDRAGIPVVMVCRPNSRSSAVFHGKGLDIAAAKASGIMEVIEGRRMLAASFAELGMMDEARAEAKEVLRLHPEFTISRWRHRPPYRDAAILERFIEGLRKAGLP